MTEKNIRRKSKSKVKNTVLIVLLTILSVMLIIVAACLLLINHYLGMIGYIDPDDTSYNIRPEDEYFDTDGDDTRDPDDTSELSPVIDPDQVLWPGADDISDLADDDLINIILVGQDRREGQGRQRSDSMILVSINPKTNKVSLISFLRDTWVQIPGGYSDNRLNVAYEFGGFKLLKETMKLNFGVTIDGGFEVDFYDFIEIIDMLGGVEIDVTEKEAAHMKSFLKVNVSPGHQTLNGEQALAYSRIRKIDSDWQRTKRQRTVLLSLFNKFKNASIFELNSIATEILPKLETDMTQGQKWGLLSQLLPLMSSMEVSSYSVPFSGAYQDAKIRGMAVLVPDLIKIREKLANEYLPF